MRHARLGAKANDGFIPELHGLRGLALTMVVLFHLVGNGRVSGGVDVFLVISGFLLTRSMYRRLSSREPGTLIRHYSRTAARLVPPALVVLVAVATMTYLFLPQPRWIEIGREIVASLLYFENWELINSQLEYGAAGPDASPLQHFWSLSIQGQYFAIWPIVMLLTVSVVKRTTMSTWAGFFIVSLAITLASLIYAVSMVTTSQDVAYFHSGTRLWQLGAGSILALILIRWELPRLYRASTGWIGLGMIITTPWLFDAANTFPGVQALWPAVGTALVLSSSGEVHAFSIGKFLQTKPLVKLADIAYPLYLWHWPLLIVYLTIRGYEHPGWRSVLGLIVLSLILSELTHRLVSQRSFKFLIAMPKRRTIAIPLAGSLAIAIAIAGIVNNLHEQRTALLAELVNASTEHPGALDGPGSTESYSEPYRPDITAAAQDRPSAYADKCIQRASQEPDSSEVRVCRDEFGNGSSKTKTVVLSGDSHAAQWYTPMVMIAEREGWDFYTVARGRCRLTSPEQPSTNDEPCPDWAEGALEVILNLEPDVVINIDTRTPTREGVERIEPGQIPVWRTLKEHEIPVIALRDNPRFPWSVPDCIDQNNGDTFACGVTRERTYNPDYSSFHDNYPENVLTIDTSDYFCDDDRCEVVIGNVLAYRDYDHISDTFARSLAPFVREDIYQVIPEIFN